MNTSSLLFGLAAPLLLGLTSQSPPSEDCAPNEKSILADPSAPDFMTALGSAAELSRLVFDEPGDGTIWVHGRTFKARFDCKGFEYIPFLGSDAPQDYPIDFTIESARVGSTELAWQSGVQPERDGETVTFHRGAFDEVYVIGPDSIEQNFIVRERRTSGDLHVVVHTDTKLERNEGLIGTEFANELGCVRYGSASTRDARGRSVESATQLVDESIEIVVPQDQLETASFPIAIDPLITTWTVTLIPSPTSNFPDTSYDWWTDSWLCVNQETFSATDHDIVARQFNSSGTMLNQTFIEQTSSDWTRPRVANNRAQHVFMVTAEVAASTATASVQARTYTATTRSIGAPLAVSPSTPGIRYWCPDIGGDNFPNGTPPFCVAYLGGPSSGTSPTSAFCARVSPLGTVFPQVSILQVDQEPVRVSKSNGNWSYGEQRWVIVGESGTTTLLNGSIAHWLTCATADSYGSVSQQGFLPANTLTGYNVFSVTPLLDGSGTQRQFAFSWIDLEGEDPLAVTVVTIDANGNLLGGSYTWGLLAHPITGSIETDGANVYYVHEDLVTGTHGFPQGDLYLDTFHWTADSTNPSHGVLTYNWNTLLFAGSLDDETMPSLASMHSSGGGTSNMLCVYRRVAALRGSASILAAMLY